MKLLLLAGTGDARRIATELSADANIQLIASLAGATRQPVELPCEMRIGGFGGPEGLRAYLNQSKIDAVIDATHPFATRMSFSTADITKELGLPHVQMLRAPWEPIEGDNWHEIKTGAEAAAHIPTGSTVFLATGRQTLPEFANLGHSTLICRQIDPPAGAFPYLNGRFLIGRPPFSVEDELILFKRLEINWLVVKNSGGGASRSKLDAARLLRIPVAMIARPKQPDCLQFARVADVVQWAKDLSTKC